MAREVIENYSKFFFLASFIGVILLSIYLVKSYIISLVGATLLAYIFYPVYVAIQKKVRGKKTSSLLTTLLVVIIIFIPLIFAANALIGESVEFFHMTKDLDLVSLGNGLGFDLGGAENLNEQIGENLNKISLEIARATSEFVVSLPKKILNIFVMLFLMYFLFMEGNKCIEKIKNHIPLKAKQKHELSKKFNNVIYASLYGMVVTAFVQGAVGALGFWVFGVSSPILWGLVTIIVAILPFVGAALVWLPAAIYKLAVGEMFNGIGLLLYGVLIISTIDNFIRPSIVGSRGNVHPALVLLGVLGGLELFGFLGIILGPLILSIGSMFLDMYLLEKKPQ